MALISCPECLRTVSEFAQSCPNCGYPLKKSKGNIETKKVVHASLDEKWEWRLSLMKGNIAYAYDNVFRITSGDLNSAIFGEEGAECAWSNALQIVSRGDMGIDETLKFIRFLKKNGADERIETESGGPLNHCKHSQVADLLISLGANVNAKDRNLDTPLHQAARRESHELVTILIEHGANVHAVDRWKRTPLHIASESFDRPFSDEQFLCVKILVGHGAKITVRDDFGLPPVYYMVKSGNLKGVEFFLSHLIPEEINSDIDFKSIKSLVDSHIEFINQQIGLTQDQELNENRRAKIKKIKSAISLLKKHTR